VNITQIWLSTAQENERPELPEPIVDSMDSVAECLCIGKEPSEYRFYDNEKVEKFLKANFGLKVLDAYDKLQSLAYRCDLARYCILYELGGWYVDAAITWIEPVTIPDHVELVAFRSVGRYSRNSWSCDNGVIYAQAKHPALKQAIDNVLANVENQYYGMTPLCPTGPSLWGRSIAECAVETHEGLHFGDCMELTSNHILKNKSFVLPDGRIIAECKRAGGGDLESLGATDSNNYNKLWHGKRVYA